MSAPMAASNEGETTTIYFAVDSNIFQETYRVHLYAQKNNGRQRLGQGHELTQERQQPIVMERSARYTALH